MLSPLVAYTNRRVLFSYNFKLFSFALLQFSSSVLTVVAMHGAASSHSCYSGFESSWLRLGQALAHVLYIVKSSYGSCGLAWLMRLFRLYLDALVLKISITDYLGVHCLPPVALGMHSVGNAEETGNVCPIHQRRDIVALGEGLAGLVALLEAVGHDVLELSIDFLRRPLREGRVLLHLETGDGHTTCIRGLARSVVDRVVARLAELASVFEDVNSFLSRTLLGIH